MYLAEGAHRYDFLAGAERYKLSFTTATAPLYWIEIGHARLPTALMDRLKKIKNHLSQ
jgi:hypothetical protein